MIRLCVSQNKIFNEIIVFSKYLPRLANVKRNVIRTAASKILQVEASLCSVTLTAAIRNVLVKPAKSTASQTTESNYVNCQLPPRASVWRAV